MDGHNSEGRDSGAKASKKIRRSDSSDSHRSSHSSSTVRSQMLAMQQYKRSASHASKSSMSMSDSEDELSFSKQQSKKLSKGPLKKRRKLAIDSDSEGEGNAAGIFKKRPGGGGQQEGESNDTRKKQSSVAPPKRKQGIAISAGVKNKRELKPLLEVGQEVVAAWWESPEKRRTNSESSWYDGRIREVKQVDRGSDYGPVRYYSIDYDDGDELDDVLDVYVMPRQDYSLSMERKEKVIGVETVADEHAPADDRYARTIGWYTANIDGEDCSFPLLSEAMRAYDSSVVRRKVEKTRPCDLNLPEEWEWSTPEWDEALLASLTGFSFNEEKNKYRVKMTHGDKDRNVGNYKLASDAARAYDEALKLLKGRAGGANFVTEQDHKNARAFEMRSTGLNVGYEKIREYMLSKINGIISKVERATTTAVPPGSTPITSLRDHDVLSGRGPLVNRHPGNVRYRSIVDMHIAEYLRADKKGDVAAKVVASIRGLDPPGRFLSKENGSKFYLEIGDELARSKAQLCLKTRASSEEGDGRAHTAASKGNSPSDAPIRSYHDHDVLMGGVSESKQHPGNIYYRKLVDNHKEDYANGSSLKDEAAKVVASIRSLTPRGRFLKRKDNGSWVDIGDEQAKSNARNALYDAAKRRSPSGKSPSSPSSRDSKKTPSTDESASEDETEETRKQSSFVGVSWHKEVKKWQSYCWHKKTIFFGYYALEADAAYAHDEGARLLKPDSEMNFATTEDYKRAKKRELRQTGLGKDAAWSSAAITSKVAGVVEKHQESQTTAASVEDKTAIAAGPPADHPELVALNQALEKKWAKYLPKTSGQQFTEDYQKEIDAIIDDVEPRGAAPADGLSTVSIGNDSSLASVAANASVDNRSDASTLQMQSGKPVAARGGELHQTEPSEEPTLKAPFPLPSSAASGAEKSSKLQPRAVSVVPAEPPKRREVNPESLMKLSKGQAADLPFPSGCPVWFEFGSNASAEGGTATNFGQSFRTGVIADAFLDLSSRDLVYSVKLAGSEATELVSEHDLLAYAPKCPVSIASSGDDANVLSGEVLMCQVKSHQQLVVEVKRLQQSLANEEAAQANEKLLGIIDRLGKIKMSRPILAETRIGKSVKELKSRSRDGRVKKKAKELEDGWRAVAEKEKKQTGNSQGNAYSLAYTILVLEEGNQFRVEENVSAEFIKYRKVAAGSEENESSHSTITTATGLC